MASPKYLVFFIFDQITGAPITGATIGVSGIHFLSYKDHNGANISQPTIVEMGGGGYGFIPTFSTDQGISYCIDCGSGAQPPNVFGYLRPEDYYVDVPVSTRYPVDSVKFHGEASVLAVAMVRTIDARTVEVIYTLPVVNADALQQSNYSFDQNLRVEGVSKVTDSIYHITTNRQTNDREYTLTVALENIHILE